MKILFLCVANSARSQMAEGLAKKILGTKAEIQSAGSEPSGKVNPFAIQALKEVGIDLSSHTSKSWNDLPSHFMSALDFVITLCAEEICPVIHSNAKKLYWGMPDPASAGQTDAERAEAFRRARDSIREKLERFRETLA